MSTTMQRRFQPFCLPSNHQNLSHMVGQNPNNAVCVANVSIFSSTVCGLLPSIWPVWSPPGSLVWWWTCHKLCLSATFVKVWGKKPSGSRSTSFSSFVLCLEVMPRQQGERSVRGLTPAVKTQNNTPVQFSASRILSLHIHIYLHHVMALFHSVTNGTRFDKMCYILGFIFLYLIDMVLFTNCKEQFDCLFNYSSLQKVFQVFFSHENVLVIRSKNSTKVFIGPMSQ